MHETVRRHPKFKRLLWLDGDIALRCPLTDVNEALNRQHFYTLQSQSTISRWVHPSTRLYLGMTESKWNTAPMGSGGVVAFDLESKHAREVLNDWHRKSHPM
jgi:hypothetical protein